MALHLVDLHVAHVDAIQGEEDQTNRLVELNVQTQVHHLAMTSIIQKAWKTDNRPDLHGWVYGLKDGLIKPVYEMKAGAEMDPAYQFDGL